MFAYIIRRLIYLIPLLLGVTFVSFFVMQLAPGDFLTPLMLNPEISEETRQMMRAQFGLDQPILVQYLIWLKNVVFHLDFGRSFTWGAPVSYLIATRALNTLILAVAALGVAWLLSIPIGVHAAVRQYSWSDKLLTTFSFLGLSIPNWFLALLMLFFIVKYNVPLPVGGVTSLDYEWMTFSEKVVDRIRHLIIPVLVLGTGSMAGLMRYMRGSLLEVLRHEYVTTARAKGLPEWRVIWKHAVRNALNPLITLFGFELGGIMSGYALTEIVVGWPGMGKLLLEAVQSQDYYLVMGGLVMSSVLLVLGNLVADILLALSDPRIRYQ